MANGNAWLSGFSVDVTGPFRTNEVPAPAATDIAAAVNIALRIDDDVAVDLSTLQVQVQEGAGPVEDAIINGVLVAPFDAGSSSITPASNGYDLILDRATDYGSLAVITVSIQADDTSGNSHSSNYSFTIANLDSTAPILVSCTPADASTGVDDDEDTFNFVIDDPGGTGVVLASIQVSMTINAGPSEDAVISGVIQPGWSGSLTPLGDGFDVTLTRDTPFGASAAVVFTIDAADDGGPPNVMPTETCSFFTSFPAPSAIIAQTEYHALLGSIIQLDGRRSSSPDGAPVTIQWRFVAVPAGSVLEEDVGLLNPDSMVALRQGHRAISFIPDLTGTYIVELVVSNGGEEATRTAIVSVGLSLVPCGEGVVPDARFLWRFLSNFYELVEDREYFQVMWSAAIQIAGADLTTLYSNDSNKSLETIQNTVMRRWQQIKPLTDLLANPQSLVIGNTTAGTLGTSGPAEGTDPATTAFLDAPTAGPYAVVGKVFKLQVDKDPPFGLEFTGTNPLTAQQVVDQVNGASGSTVAEVQGASIRIISGLIGDDSFIEVLGEDAAADFGWALNQTVQGQSSGLTRVFRAPLGDRSVATEDNFTLIDVNYGARGRIIDINGRGYTIDRVFNQSNAEVAVDSALLYNGTAFTDITVQAKEDEDNATLFAADLDYLYIGHVTPFETIRVVLSTLASADITAVFEASDGSGGWIGFAPTGDGTTGFSVSPGDITIDVTALLTAGWLSQSENGQTRYWVRIQRTNAAAITAPVEQSIKVVDSITIVSLLEEELPDGQKGVPYRIPHLLHTPGIDLEENGVSAGDVLVLEATRRDSNISAEFRAQVVVVDGERLGFEFDLADIVDGAQDVLDHATFRQLVQDLRIVSPVASDPDIASVAEALIQLFPTGVNLAQRPFSTFQITVRAKKVIQNRFLKINDLIVGLPTLQEELKPRPEFIYLEGTDYVLDAGYLVWQRGLFGPSTPAPEELWAECAHVNNNPTIEKNFGVLVDLSEDDLVDKATRAPYLSAVKGLWYAITGSPSVANVRLALQILMGLPFSEARGSIIRDDPSFTRDSSGDLIGRLLVEDVDDNDRPIGFRRFYFYPDAIGLDLNPNTGETFKVGDIIDAFVPISKGVVVEDHVNNPLWWVRNLAGQEIRKYHTFRGQIDTESGVFDENDLVFSVQFLRSIKPTYTNLLASVLQTLEDDEILNVFQDFITGSSVVTRFYDNVGAYGGHESTVRNNDMNHQGFMLWRGDARPFSTRKNPLIRDLATAQNGATVEATAGVSFGSIRNRVLGDSTHPTVEGDIVAILQNQPGAGPVTPGLYEITAGAPAGPLVLGNEVSPSDPTTWDVNAPDEVNFPYGTDLLAVIVRRALNPVVQGSNLESFGSDEVESAGATFIDDGVAIDDHLIIESGANEGEWRIVSMVAQVSPRDRTPSGVPQIQQIRLKLVNMDGSSASIAVATGQDFRIIRPAFQRSRVTPARVLTNSGDLYVEVKDFAPGTQIPFDVFSPAMVGESLNVQSADNPDNDGDYTIFEYLHAGLVRVTDPQGGWLTATPYTRGDSVSNGGSDYACILDHTSGASNEPGVGGSWPTFWVLQATDSNNTAIVTVRSKFHPGFEKSEELAPLELFEAEVV